MPLGPWTSIDLATVSIYFDTTRSAGTLLASDGSCGAGNCWDGWGYFSPVEIVPGTATFEFEATFLAEAGADYLYLSGYSIVPSPADEDDVYNSTWYGYGFTPTIAAVAGNTYTRSFTLGPGIEQYDDAVFDGETRMLLEFGHHVTLTAARWRELDPPVQGSATPTGAPALSLDVYSGASSPGSTSSHYPSSAGAGARWWTFTPGSSGYFEFDSRASASGDSYITVYAGNPNGAGATVDDVRLVTQAATYPGDNGWGVTLLDAGVTYFVRLGEFNPTARVIVRSSAFTRTGLQGGANHRDAPALTELSVSDWSRNDYAGPASNYYYAMRNRWWTFTATQTGLISFDVLLSRDTGTTSPPGASPAVRLVLYEIPQPDTTPFTHYYDESSTSYAGVNRGRIVRSVIAGQVYHLQVGTLDSQSIEYALRVSDYATVSDWIQGPTQTPVYNLGGAGYVEYEDLHHPPTPEYDVNGGYGAYSREEVVKYRGGFHGLGGVGRSFGGPYPGDDPDAITCSWRMARKGNYGDGWYWSPGNGVEWLGGPGDCPPHTAKVESGSNDLDRPSGWSYYSEPPNIYQTVSFRVFGVAYTCNFTRIEELLGPAGGLDAYAYAVSLGYTPYSIAWEDPTCEVVSADAAADEYDDGGAYATGNVSEWYAAATQSSASVDWGMGDEGAGYPPIHWGSGSGPEAMIAASQFLSNYSGGLSSWVAVDTGVFAAARAWEAANPNGAYVRLGGLTLTAVPSVIINDASPGVPSGTDVTVYNYRANQVTALRPHIVPSRFRVTPDPGIPDLTPGVIMVVRQYPRDDQYGYMGSAPRIYPIPRRSRVVGGLQ